MYEEDKFDLPEDSYSPYFKDWDNALKQNKSPKFLEVEDIEGIFEEYLEESDIDSFRASVKYALAFHPNNEELIIDIMAYMEELSLWKDLYNFAIQYDDIEDAIYPRTSRLKALLHMGLEEDAFGYFQELKKIYSERGELSMIYVAMSEALNSMRLNDAAIKVIKEATSKVGDFLYLNWIELRAYADINDKENALALADRMEKKMSLSYECWEDLAIIFLDLEEYERAIESMEYAKTLGAKSLDLYTALIECYTKNNNPLKALEIAKECIEIYPDTLEVIPIAIVIAIQIEAWDEVFMLIDKIIGIEPSEEIYLCKSDVFIKFGEYKKAIQTLQEGLIALEGDNESIKKQLAELTSQYPDLVD
ncbi:tetratricopeptide (TPR) repeat protein [Dysgonomonadaceae bacterium PH5-43]|nr:tetratricopeptide (TPR) repeat protein [Dysgonomonadaceae bacterium PH5-43]